ncbi:glycosylated lysosomal membrane protein B-like [Gigantopelta aegis]|uniref:glycosylated lysosomal membrane protein B-like n=1 Tax=Gigantopelta aegis TaxID=1735272 RepID=UPI001B88A331|nr:glycosylated lysosomal membrane protein B-like [Gigantopelta aegis]
MAAFIRVCFTSLIFFLPLLSCVLSKGHRALEIHFNPNCTRHECDKGVNGSFANLVYVRAKGSSDYLHYMFSTVGVPAVIIARTKPDPTITLRVNWDKLLAKNGNISNALTLTGDPHKILNSFGTVFTKLLEYNDTDDTADLSSYPLWNSTDRNNRPFTEFKWNKVQKLNETVIGFVFKSTVWQNKTLTESEYSDEAKNRTASLSFTFRLFVKDDRESQLPHLEFSENSTQFDLTIDNMKPCCTRSRFALEVAMLTDPLDKAGFKMEETKSIDDEYSPGVFRMVSVRMSPSDQAKGGFLQWKPVCYQKHTRSRNVATSVKKYQLGDTHNVTELLKESIAHAFYGSQLFLKGVERHALNISFGFANDGFYTKTNYSSWSATLGFGEPPADKISLLVIGVISAGLGIPVILIIFGGLFVFIRKQRSKQYKPLQDVSSSYPAGAGKEEKR